MQAMALDKQNVRTACAKNKLEFERFASPETVTKKRTEWVDNSHS